jgi:hypothetical protein
MTGTSLQYSSQSCLTGISHVLKMKTWGCKWLRVWSRLQK